VALDTPGRPTPVDEALKSVSGTDLSGWDERWRAYLAANAPPLPPDTFLSPPNPKRKELSRRSRLGDLLAARDHHAAAVKELERAVAAAPTDPSGHARLAMSLKALGQEARAAKEVATLEAVNAAHPGYLALHAAVRRAAGDDVGASIAADHALWNGGLDPDVACAEAPPGELPTDPKRRALCLAARDSARDAGRRTSRH
jgi:Flp pilus assembly protein TadD